MNLGRPGNHPIEVEDERIKAFDCKVGAGSRRLGGVVVGFGGCHDGGEIGRRYISLSVADSYCSGAILRIQITCLFDDFSSVSIEQPLQLAQRQAIDDIIAFEPAAARLIDTKAHQVEIANTMRISGNGDF